LAEVLEVGASELASLGLELPEEPLKPVDSLSASTMNESVRPPDPYGNHTEQILQLGFSLGCDMHIVLKSSALTDSGVPSSSLEQFSDLLPLKLDAAFHHHNDPHFLPTGVRLVLSFDALYTCTIPWAAFVQVTMMPLAPSTGPEEPETQPNTSKTHLRLIE
jgi:hypothetical protein